MQLLNDYYDENSNFYQRAQPESLLQINSMRDPSKIKIIIILPMKHLKKFYLHLLLIGSIHYMNDDKEIKYVYELMKKELKLLEAPNDIILKLEEQILFCQMIYVWSFE